MKIHKETTYHSTGCTAGSELCPETAILFLCEATVMNWLPISSQSTVKNRELIGLKFMKFTIFTASMGHFEGSMVVFSLPVCACG
jgi:hypothetical protein